MFKQKDLFLDNEILDNDIPRKLSLTYQNGAYTLLDEKKRKIDSGKGYFAYDKKHVRIDHEDGTCTLYDENGEALEHAKNVKRCGIEGDGKHYWVDNGKKIKNYLLREAKMRRIFMSITFLAAAATVLGVSECVEKKEKANIPETPVPTSVQNMSQAQKTTPHLMKQQTRE